MIRRRTLWRRIRPVLVEVLAPPLIILAMALLLLLLPVLLPYLAWIQAASRRRLVAAAAVQCTVCGGPLGQPALDRSDATWKAHVDALHAANPFVRFRLVRRSRAECPACGGRYGFDEGRRVLTLLTDAPA